MEVKRIGNPGAKPINPALTFLILAALVAADYVVFRHFDRQYLRWYAAQGPLISVAVSAIAVVVDLDQDRNLISAHPGKYAGAWGAVPGVTSYYLSQITEADTRPGLDGIITGLSGLALVALWACWLIVIAPVQYFVTLIAGAPARSAIAGGRHVSIERPDDTETIVIRSVPFASMPEGAQEVGLARRPVTVTSTITAGLLFAISQFI